MDPTLAEQHRAGDALARRLREAVGSTFVVLSVFVDEHQVILGADGLPAAMQAARCRSSTASAPTSATPATSWWSTT